MEGTLSCWKVIQHYIRGSTVRRNDFLSQIDIDMKKLPVMMVHLDNKRLVCAEKHSPSSYLVRLR
jgi:hypothetical protein